MRGTHGVAAGARVGSCTGIGRIKTAAAVAAMAVRRAVVMGIRRAGSAGLFCRLTLGWVGAPVLGAVSL